MWGRVGGISSLIFCQLKPTALFFIFDGKDSLGALGLIRDNPPSLNFGGTD